MQKDWVGCGPLQQINKNWMFRKIAKNRHVDKHVDKQTEKQENELTVMVPR
jgi:hypothetical protein